jgi:hypothetical protein
MNKKNQKKQKKFLMILIPEWKILCRFLLYLPLKLVIHRASSVYNKVLSNLNITEYKLINKQNDS